MKSQTLVALRNSFKCYHKVCIWRENSLKCICSKVSRKNSCNIHCVYLVNKYIQYFFYAKRAVCINLVPCLYFLEVADDLLNLKATLPHTSFASHNTAFTASCSHQMQPCLVSLVNRPLSFGEVWWLCNSGRWDVSFSNVPGIWCCQHLSFLKKVKRLIAGLLLQHTHMHAHDTWEHAHNLRL